MALAQGNASVWTDVPTSLISESPGQLQVNGRTNKLGHPNWGALNDN